MKILITGGGGFIGRNLKRLLTSFGYEVFAPTHQELDLTDFVSSYNQINDLEPNVIIHAANVGGTDSVRYDDFVENMKMFDNIKDASRFKNPIVIIIGSGAEFDRFRSVEDISESEIWNRWPTELYGLSKNIISRRTLSELDSGCVFRLFGCFGEDENVNRFIKRSVLRLKAGLPIQVYSNKKMDFFYIDDLAAAVDHFLKFGGDDNINMVYTDKFCLGEIADMIQKEMNVSRDIEFMYDYSPQHPVYTGDGERLRQMGVPLLGLQEGIRRMVKNLT